MIIYYKSILIWGFLQCRRPQFDSWVGKFSWRRDRLPSLIFLGFPGGSDGKESDCNVGDLNLIPGLGRSPGGGHGNLLQYSSLENPHGQKSLVGYTPWGHKESDTMERLSTAQHPYLHMFFLLFSSVQFSCSVLGSTTMHKVSGGDGIPAELLQILKDDPVRVLHSTTCQQIWKTQQWPQDWKRSISFQSQRRAIPKNVKLPHNCTHFTG